MFNGGSAYNGSSAYAAGVVDRYVPWLFRVIEGGIMARNCQRA